MSITRNHNGSTTLTSLAELGEVLDVRSLPSGPDVSADDLADPGISRHHR
jgi:hypothetical protein